MMKCVGELERIPPAVLDDKTQNERLISPGPPRGTVVVDRPIFKKIHFFFQKLILRIKNPFRPHKDQCGIVFNSPSFFFHTTPRAARVFILSSKFKKKILSPSSSPLNWQSPLLFYSPLWILSETQSFYFIFFTKKNLIKIRLRVNRVHSFLFLKITSFEEGTEEGKLWIEASNYFF